MKNRAWMGLSVVVVAAMALAAPMVIAGEPSKDKSGMTAETKTGVKIGEMAPAFSLKDQDGKTVSLADYKGKIVVLEWFNDDCPVVVRCHKAKTMTTIANEFKAKDVVWLAIDSTNTKHANFGTNKDTLKEWGITYPVLQDADGKTGKAYGATNTPHMFIIGKDGKLAYMGAIDNDKSGNMPEAERTNYVKQALNQLVAGETVTTPETKAYGCTVKYGG